MNQSYYPENRKRIPELDALKTIAVIAMVFVHVLELSPELDTSDPFLHGTATIIEFFGCVPSAGLFMFAMGWGAALSRKTTGKALIDRFLQLSLLGLLVNFFQQLVPMILDPEVFGRPEENLFTIIAVDIYQFAALATLYFAVMQKLNRNSRPALVFSISLVSVCMVLNAVFGFETFTTGSSWYDTLIGLFIRENEYSYFPFISWIVFPAAGYEVAFLYQKLEDKKTTLLWALVTGVGLILLSEFLMNIFSIPDIIIRHVYPAEEAYYAMHPICAFGALGIIITEFVLVSCLLKLLKERLSGFFKFVSGSVMLIYVAQWIMIGLLSPVLNNITDLGVNMLLSLGVLTAACLLAVCYKNIKKKMAQKTQRSLDHLVK